ncbi:hypothetical protein HHK36_016765 [Tetracentron sinense]|uniref:Uncharacterized protein n=1 Tax=Tetracentron sinense TaxID=13715 RepID=A0A834Z1B0_TETSI|nr:hypothetical protein HHK36_016765 [Tetracentron sinense]
MVSEEGKKKNLSPLCARRTQQSPEIVVVASSELPPQFQIHDCRFNSPRSSLVALNPKQVHLQRDQKCIMSEHEDHQVKTLHEHLHPTRTATPSCIIFHCNVKQFDFKPGMIQLLPTFHGLDNENLYVHIIEFEEVVATFHNQSGIIDAARLNFFLHSL